MENFKVFKILPGIKNISCISQGSSMIARGSTVSITTTDCIPLPGIAATHRIGQVKNTLFKVTYFSTKISAVISRNYPGQFHHGSTISSYHTKLSFQRRCSRCIGCPDPPNSPGHLPVGRRQVSWFSVWIKINLTTFTSVSRDFETNCAALIIIQIKIAFKWLSTYRIVFIIHTVIHDRIMVHRRI